MNNVYATSPSLPSGVQYYAPITITYNGLATYPSTLQVNITYNALAYQQYETNGLNNMEFFYSNGMVINSWVEGNVLNETQNSLLYTSANIMWWTDLSNSILVTTANSAATNTIYIGFAGNALTSANTLMNGVQTGAAPQLYSGSGSPGARRPATANTTMETPSLTITRHGEDFPHFQQTGMRSAERS